VSSGPATTRALALPLRIGANGQFERADQVQGLMALVAAMAVTAPGAWPHAPWFALLPVFARVNREVKDHPVIADALNEAFDKLGVSSCRVSGVTTSDDPDAAGEHSFDITLTLDGGQIRHQVLKA
jgi:hypothetical protein